MKEVQITGELREDTGKGVARQTRMAGYIPAVVYGPEIKSFPIKLNERTFKAAMKGTTTSTILNLTVGDKQNKVVVRDIQRDPITNRAIHLDFHAISMTKPLNISIPIHFEGEPIGVKVDGGIMQTTMRELEISCLPANIPESLKVDVSELAIGDSIHIKDITIPNVEILSEAKRTMVVISAPTIIKVDEPTEEEAALLAAEAEEGAEGAEGAEGTAEGDTKKDEDPKKDDKK